MGNSCNKVAPIGCTTQITCTVPQWCSTPLCCGEPKVQPDDPKSPAHPTAAADTYEPKATPVEPFEPVVVVVPEAASQGTRANGTSKPDAGEAAADDDLQPKQYTSTEDEVAPKVEDVDAVDQSAAGPAEPVPAAQEPTDAPAGNEAADSSAPQADTTLDTDAMVPTELAPEESAESLAEYSFDDAALVALEHFALKDIAEVLVCRSSGQAAVQVIQLLCQHALDAGAASHNCKRLLTQVRLITDVLARAQRSGVQKRVVRAVLVEELQPILERAAPVFQSWSCKGQLEKFFSGRDADEDFLALHLELKDCCQSPSFAQLLQVLPGEQWSQGQLSSSDGGARVRVVEEPTGYSAVEAAKAAFERLLLLFILRYKPSATRTQKERLLDMLNAYNSAGGSFEEKFEHLVKARLNKAPKNVLPLLETIMMNMWGATAIPTSCVGKWRTAVRLALEPLRAATGEWQLPVPPAESSEEFVDD